MQALVSDDLRLDDVLEEHRRSRPHEVAVVDGEIRFDYAQIAVRNERLVRLLLDPGVGAGDRVAWVGQNSFRVLEH